MQSIQNLKQLELYVEKFSKLPCVWFVCGGWAVDLFLGKATRIHSDVEIGFFREDQNLAFNAIKDLQPEWVIEKKFYPWVDGQYLELPIHEVWCQKSNPILEILFNEKKENLFVFRRDTRIVMPLNRAILIAKNGVPFLAPEIVLLYKSKHTQEKDEIDFKSVLPFLDVDSITWLHSSLTVMYESDHPWIISLNQLLITNN